MLTVKVTTNRFNQTIWIVTWGPGLTQTAIALTRAEADDLVEGKRKSAGPLIWG